LKRRVWIEEVGVFWRRWRPFEDSKIDEAWGSVRAARIKMRLLVQGEQEQVRDAYERVVRPLRDAYEETGDPCFALLALRPLQPHAASHTGRKLQYTHAPSWAVQALMRAIEQSYSGPLKGAEQLWLAAERDTTQAVYDELDRFSEREIRRVLRRWFSTEERMRRASEVPVRPDGRLDRPRSQRTMLPPAERDMPSTHGRQRRS
jgi:hypothetical protein